MDLSKTSFEYILIGGCKKDHVSFPFIKIPIHKQKIGILIVVLDFLSIIVLAYFFQKIKDLNKEYLDCLDDLDVQMKDFGIKIDDVKLDRHS